MRRDPPELKAPQRQRKNCAWPALMSAGLNDQRVSCAFFLTGYTVSDTFSFLDTISNVKNADDYVMASIDIVSLYTSVPVRETIDILIETD